MRAHNVIIITTGASQLAVTGELDELVARILKMNKNPILVLGPDGDEILRHCQRIDDCDVVFDPNFQGGTFSGIKAGLQATHGPAFVISLDSSHPDDELWSKLERELLVTEPTPAVDVIHPITHEAGGALSFPLLITSRGVKTLVSLPAAMDWKTPEGFTIRHIPCQAIDS